MPSTHAAAAAEVRRIKALDRGLDAKVVKYLPIPSFFDVAVKDARMASPNSAGVVQNQALPTDGYTPGSWNPYEVGTAANWPNSAVTFT